MGRGKEGGKAILFFDVISHIDIVKNPRVWQRSSIFIEELNEKLNGRIGGRQ